MNTIDLSLNFDPKNNWPKALPSFVWNNLKLCRFYTPDKNPIVSLSQYSFEEAFYSCYPQLTLSELARLYQKINQQKKLFLSIEWSSFFKHYKMRYNDNLHQLLLQLPYTPLSFQNWVSDKSVSQGDLAVLRSFDKKDHNLFLICDKISSLQPTKSWGIKVLNLACEVSLLHHKKNKNKFKKLTKNIDFLNGVNIQFWFKNLYQLRYPNSFQKDQIQQTNLKQLPWSKNICAKWVRRGDRSGVEICFMAESQKDFQTKVDGLNYINSIFNRSDTLLWK